MMNTLDSTMLNSTQTGAYQLIRNDYRFVYSLICFLPEKAYNFYTQFMPYLATIVDGSEEWLKAVNKDLDEKLPGRTFNPEEEKFYSAVRSSIKFWSSSYDKNYELLERIYSAHIEYFNCINRPLVRLLGLSDFYGVFSTKQLYCGNTILADLYIPNYNILEKNSGLFIKDMTVFAREYIRLFNALEPLSLCSDKQFYDYDFGGIRKSPVGNVFSDKFVLLTILCQINFVLYCINDYFNNAISTEIRFSYLIYYYLCNALNEINTASNSFFFINDDYCSTEYRNCVAHYKVGASLTENEIIISDPLFGMTQKYLGIDSYVLRSFLISELDSLSKQITKELRLKPLDSLWSVKK